MTDPSSRTTVKKVLIANRGEIAVRVIRTCREMNIRTVAVCSSSDVRSPHALSADETVLMEGSSTRETYLDGERLLAIAREKEVDAIHPGYGFLSENAEFAEACAAENIIFIGPDPHSIRDMGDKTRARELMQQAGVPFPPGAKSALSSDDEAKKVADEIGYPVLVKAAAGGGGKGMRKVDDAADLPQALKAARSESAGAFGDDRIYIEKYLEEPRHIEFQILADRHGNIVHLFDRECSIQRRHQKVIEEAPSPLPDENLREEMGRAAVRVARSCNYVGAGTVEFLVDRHRRFYFLEMNTRLQVEHPVTEMITGMDLVAWQIRIAEGSSLPWKQEELSFNGHAIECRICAEDPMEQFLPATGTIMSYHPPTGPQVRMDDGIRSGQTITAEYDPLLAKLVVHGEDRKRAIARMIRALDETVLTGIPTTVPFCRYVMESQHFVEGEYDTHFIADHFSAEQLCSGSGSHHVSVIAGLLQMASNGTDPSLKAGETKSVNEASGFGKTANEQKEVNLNRKNSGWWNNRKYRS